MTSLPRHYTPAEMRAAAARDAKVRIDGNANLLAAFGDAGVRRYVLQSSGFRYAPGAGLADESASFAFEASPSVAEAHADMPNGKQGCEGPRGLAFRARCIACLCFGSWSLPSDNQAWQHRHKKRVTKAGDVTGTSHFMRTFNGSVGQGGKP